MITRTPLARLSLLAVAGAALSLSACAPREETSEPVGDGGFEPVAEDDGLTGSEISEAVPGVTAASPEGDTSTTADLDEEGNAAYTDTSESDREAKTAAD